MMNTIPFVMMAFKIKLYVKIVKIFLLFRGALYGYLYSLSADLAKASESQGTGSSFTSKTNSNEKNILDGRFQLLVPLSVGLCYHPKV
jgi:hypothetical protein